MKSASCALLSHEALSFCVRFLGVSSDQDIYFPVGYGIRLLIINNDKWIEVKNKDIYYGDGSWLQTKRDQMLGARLATGVRPILPPDLLNVGNQVILRIVIIGEIHSNNSNNGLPVGAFTDLFVTP
jgi:hypothetical protein